jgi:hypothetical protein
MPPDPNTAIRPFAQGSANRAAHLKAAACGRLVGREKSIGNKRNIWNHLIAHDLAIDETERMADPAVPVVFQPRKLVRAGDVEPMGDEVPNQVIGKLGMAGIFGIDRRFVPPFRGVYPRRVASGLFGGGRLVPDFLTIENREGG